MQEFEELAKRLADEAGEIVQKYYRTSFDVENKDDESPVTVADKAIEERLREIIEQERPEDGILGEEFGVKESANGYTWVLDPIDGTKSFVIGRPTFGTLIALCKDDAPVLGVIDQAISKERWIGVEGKKTTFNGQPVQTSKCPSLDQARCASTTPDMFLETGPVYQNFPRGQRFAWGGDCYIYGLMANGYVDVIIEANMQVYDYLAHVPIVKGAGGFISDWDGNDLTLKSDGKVFALGDPTLWEKSSDLLKMA